MRLFFVIQGEGRGHMTQAIALRQLLIAGGRELCAVCVDRSKSRALPQFFLDRIAAPVLTYDSPNFKTDADRRGVSLIGTALDNLKRLPRFANGFRTLRDTIAEHDPHFIVNFFDPLAAIYAAWSKPRSTMVSVGHQYLLLHPQFVFPAMSVLSRLALIWFIKVCALGSERLMALSFREMHSVPHKKLTVMPPLLREELCGLTPETGEFLLAYVLNDGYADDLAAQQRLIPDVKIIGFWARKGAERETEMQTNFVFRQLDDTAFFWKP